MLANELVSYLALSHENDPQLNIGDDLIVSAEEGKYENRFRVVLPAKLGADDYAATGSKPARRAYRAPSLRSTPRPRTHA